MQINEKMSPVRLCVDHLQNLSAKVVNTMIQEAAFHTAASKTHSLKCNRFESLWATQ